MIHHTRGTNDQSETSFRCLLLHIILVLISVKYIIQKRRNFF